MTEYVYANISTVYKGVRFRSRLEARWAAFMDLVGWEWEYEPLDLKGWIPDFLVRIPCTHSECCMVQRTECPHCGAPVTEVRMEPVVSQHPWGDPDIPDETHLVEMGARCHGCGKVHELWSLSEKFHHELYAEVKPYSTLAEFDGHPVCRYFDKWTEPVGAKFGQRPEVSAFQIAHGAGGGIYSVLDWSGVSSDLWDVAGNVTRYSPNH